VKPHHSLLVVEDEEIIRTALKEFLDEEGYDVTAVGSVAAAVKAARERDFHVAVCDVQLPDGDGVALLRRLMQFNPNVSGLIITAYATVENAVEAFKAGAFDYLVKPVIFDDLANKLQRLFQYRELYQENQALRRELARRDGNEQIVGSSKAIQEVQEAIRKVAVTNANVLLEGESGTGKELFARTIHQWGPKKHERFLAANCAAGPADAVERMLFGTAGSEAIEESGILRHAEEGTVFLDEITQLPLSTQAKLLRAIEYGEITPVGGSEPQRHHARLIVATTHDLSREVADGRFNENLFYRLDGL
jgi:DNA-binding NtrC family response regulator